MNTTLTRTRPIWILLLLLAAGCAGKSPATLPSEPDPTPAAGGNFEIIERSGMVNFRGSVTLQGTAAMSPNFTKPPFKLTVPASIEQILSLRFTATAAPSANRTCLIRVVENGITIGETTAPSNGGTAQMSVTVIEGPTVDILFYNSATPTGTQHPEALTWSGNVWRVQAGATLEPDSDSDESTHGDYAIGSRLPLTAPDNYATVSDSLSFYSNQEQDLEDWFPVYRHTDHVEFKFNPPSKVTDPWNYRLRVFNDFGVMLFETPYVTATRTVHIDAGQITSIAYVQVTGAPQQPFSIPGGHLKPYTIQYRNDGADHTFIGISPPQLNPIGHAGETVTLTALYEGDPLVQWSVDSGDPARIVGSPLGPTCQIFLEAPGNITLNITLDSNPATEQTRLEFPATIGFRVPPTFASRTISQIGPLVSYSDTTILDNNRIGLCWQDVINEDLYFAYTTINDPALESDWTVHRVAGANGARVGRYCQIGVVGDNPVIAHFNDTYNVMSIARSAVALPTSGSDWINHTIDIAGSGRWPSMLGGTSGLSIAYQGYGGTLRFARSTNAFPSSKDDYVKHDIAPGPNTGMATAYTKSTNSGYVVATLERQGAASSAPYRIKVYRSGATTPIAQGDWSALQNLPSADLGSRIGDFDSFGTISLHLSTTSQGGLVMIGCYDTAAGGYRIWGTTQLKAGDSSWGGAYPSTFVVPGTATGGPRALKVITDRPSLALRDMTTGQLVLGRCSSETDIIGLSRWLTGAPGTTIGGFPSQMEIQDVPAILHGPTDATGLRYTIQDSGGW